MTNNALGQAYGKAINPLEITAHWHAPDDYLTVGSNSNHIITVQSKTAYPYIKINEYSKP
ncbi:MAG: hypothetical protein Tsb002_00590 [Wenzhouxiangellaceae bacterium]